MTRLAPLALFGALLLSSAAQAQTDPSTAIRIGLGADALAAAGVSGTEVATTIADFVASAPAQAGDLAAADAVFGSTRATADKLQRLIRSGQATDAEVTEYQTAKTALATIEAERQGIIDALFDAGILALPAAKTAVLAQIRANTRYRAIPISLKVVSRTDSEWLALKKALIHERVCLKEGEEVHADVVAALATWRGATPVATAKATLDANLPTVTAAWNAALD